MVTNVCKNNDFVVYLRKRNDDFEDLWFLDEKYTRNSLIGKKIPKGHPQSLLKVPGVLASPPLWKSLPKMNMRRT